jgi:hypothetical protein
MLGAEEDRAGMSRDCGHTTEVEARFSWSDGLVAATADENRNLLTPCTATPEPIFRFKTTILWTDIP